MAMIHNFRVNPDRISNNWLATSHILNQFKTALTFAPDICYKWHKPNVNLHQIFDFRAFLPVASRYASQVAHRLAPAI